MLVGLKTTREFNVITNAKRGIALIDMVRHAAESMFPAFTIALAPLESSATNWVSSERNMSASSKSIEL
jgi:hypothetical protein